MAGLVKEIASKDANLSMVGVGGSPDSARLAVHSPFGCGANGGALTAIVTLNGQCVVLDGQVVVASMRDAICSSFAPLEAAKENAKVAHSSAAFLKQFRHASFVTAAWSDLYRMPSRAGGGGGGGGRVAMLLFGATRSGHVHVWRFEAERGVPLRVSTDNLRQSLELWQLPKRAVGGSSKLQRQTPYVTTMFVRTTTTSTATAATSSAVNNDSDTLQAMSLFVGTTDGEVHELSIAKVALSSPKFEVPSDIATGIKHVSIPPPFFFFLLD